MMALCQGRLAPGATFVSVRFSASGRMCNEHGQRQRCARDATFLAAHALDDIFSAFVKKGREHRAETPFMGRLALGPQGRSLMHFSELRRTPWDTHQAPLAIEAAEVAPRMPSTKFVDRSILADAARHEGENRLNSDPADGFALMADGNPYDGSWFHIGFYGGGSISLPPDANEGATLYWIRQRETVGVCRSWTSAAGALAFSSLLGVAPIERIGAVRFSTVETAKVAESYNRLLFSP